MGIFDPVKEQEKWLLTSRLRPIENLLCRVVGFRRDKSDHALMVPTRRKTVERLRRLDMDRNALRLRKLDKVVELPIGAENKKPLQGPRTGAQGLTHGMQPINRSGGLSLPPTGTVWLVLDDDTVGREGLTNLVGLLEIFPLFGINPLINLFLNFAVGQRWHTNTLGSVG